MIIHNKLTTVQRTNLCARALPSLLNFRGPLTRISHYKWPCRYTHTVQISVTRHWVNTPIHIKSFLHTTDYIHGLVNPQTYPLKMWWKIGIQKFNNHWKCQYKNVYSPLTGSQIDLYLSTEWPRNGLTWIVWSLPQKQTVDQHLTQSVLGPFQMVTGQFADKPTSS